MAPEVSSKDGDIVVDPHSAEDMVKNANTSRSSTGIVSVAGSTDPILDRSDHERYWPAIASKDQIPAWLRDNDYIINGHPMPTSSYRKSYRLWRMLHMETMNIWTHFLGSAAFVATGITLYQYANTSVYLTRGDKFAFGTSITAAAVCFGLSATFHTLRSHSYQAHHFWGKLDIFGICVLALGGGASATYYAFYDNVKIQRVYWGLDLCSAFAAALSLADTGGGGSKMRTLRGGVFSLLALSAMLPIFHSAGRLGWERACDQIGLQWFAAEGLTLLFGVGLFVGRIPERFSPGSFDVWAHSHQLWHICAVIATGFHVGALVEGYRYRHGSK